MTTGDSRSTHDADAGPPLEPFDVDALTLADLDDLDLVRYQQLAARTGGPISCDHPIVYPTLGLVNEAGEVAGKVKKIFRDKDGVITDVDRQALTLELGDVLWYLAELCTRLGIGLDEVAANNLIKLRDRVARGTLHGDGDNR